MNISITSKTSTQITVNTPAYYEHNSSGFFAAIIDGHLISGWVEPSISYATLRSERIKEGEEIHESSTLAQILTKSDWLVIDRERFIELFSACVTTMTLRAQEVQP